MSDCVARGRWYLREEVVGVIKLRKYRQLSQRYGLNPLDKTAPTPLNAPPSDGKVA